LGGSDPRDHCPGSTKSEQQSSSESRTRENDDPKQASGQKRDTNKEQAIGCVSVSSADEQPDADSESDIGMADEWTRHHRYDGQAYAGDGRRSKHTRRSSSYGMRCHQ
jgi:hypothetical protein